MRESAAKVIRKRPGMFIGDTEDGSGLHHMLWEVVANSVDEHMAGHCAEIAVTLHATGSWAIRDEGRGIRLDVDDKGTRFAEAVLTKLHLTATGDGHRPHAHIGLFGVGLVVVNVLSEWFEIEIRRDGGRWTQRYELGVPATSLRRVGA